MYADESRGGGIYIVRYNTPLEICGVIADGVNREQCLKSSEELAKSVKRYLKSFGIDATYLRADPSVIVVKSNKPLPDELSPYLKPLLPAPMEELIGFSADDIVYEFGKGEETKNPYDILYKPPYRCDVSTLKVSIYYEDDKYLQAFQHLLECLKNIYIMKILEIEWKFLKDLNQLLRDSGVKIAIIRNRTPRDFDYIKLAMVKSKSYWAGSPDYGISELQIIDGDKLIKLLDQWREQAEKARYYCRAYVANLITALLHKSGCIPFRVKLPSSKYNDLMRKAVIIGVGAIKLANNIYKGLAVVMTGLGEVIAVISKEFRASKGEGLEFDTIEIRKFRNSIENHLREYNVKFGKAEILVIVRSRMFLDREVEGLLGIDRSSENEGERVLLREIIRSLTFRNWWQRFVKSVLVMSVYRTSYSIGEDNAALVPARRYKGRLRGIWLVQLRGHKYATQITWDYTDGDENVPLAAYLFMRALDYRSLHTLRRVPLPIRMAERFLKWNIIKVKLSYVRKN